MQASDLLFIAAHLTLGSQAQSRAAQCVSVRRSLERKPMCIVDAMYWSQLPRSLCSTRFNLEGCRLTVPRLSWLTEKVNVVLRTPAGALCMHACMQ